MRELCDPFRGPANRPDDYETDFFWSVYVCFGYEPGYNTDLDPQPAPQKPTSLIGPESIPKSILPELERLLECDSPTYTPYARFALARYHRFAQNTGKPVPTELQVATVATELERVIVH